MKFLVSFFSVLVSINAFATTYRAEYEFSDDDARSIEEMIVKTYEAALNSPSFNDLQVAVDAFEADDENVMSVETPDVSDMLRISGGKGSASSYGFTYLVGIPVNRFGGGLIREFEKYAVVYVNMDMGEGQLTVTIEKVIELPELSEAL